MVTEGDVTLGGEHTTACAGDVLRSHTLENYITLLTNVTPANLIEFFNTEDTPSVRSLPVPLLTPKRSAQLQPRRQPPRPRPPPACEPRPRGRCASGPARLSGALSPRMHGTARCTSFNEAVPGPLICYAFNHFIFPPELFFAINMQQALIN